MLPNVNDTQLKLINQVNEILSNIRTEENRKLFNDTLGLLVYKRLIILDRLKVNENVIARRVNFTKAIDVLREHISLDPVLIRNAMIKYDEILHSEILLPGLLFPSLENDKYLKDDSILPAFVNNFIVNIEEKTIEDL